MLGIMEGILRAWGGERKGKTTNKGGEPACHSPPAPSGPITSHYLLFSHLLHLGDPELIPSLARLQPGDTRSEALAVWTYGPLLRIMLLAASSKIHRITEHTSYMEIQLAKYSNKCAVQEYMCFFLNRLGNKTAQKL